MLNLQTSIEPVALSLSPLSAIVFFCLILGFPDVGLSARLSSASITEDHPRALMASRVLWNTLPWCPLEPQSSLAAPPGPATRPLIAAAL